MESTQKRKKEENEALKKRIFSLLLVCALALTLIPTVPTAEAAYTDYDGNPIPTGYTLSDGTTISVQRLDRSLTWGQLYEGGYLSFIRTDKATGDGIGYGFYDVKNNTILFESPKADFISDTVLWESRSWYDGREVFEGIDPYTGKTGYGVLDMKGNVVVPPKYLKVYNYQDGMAMVTAYDSTNTVRIGYVDVNGNEVIPPIYDVGPYPQADHFNDGYAWVKDPDTSRSAYFLMDRKGNKVLELPGYEIEWYSLYGNNVTTSDVKCWEPVTCFSNGYAVVKFSGFRYNGPNDIGYSSTVTKEDLNLSDYMLIDLQGNLTLFDKDFFYNTGVTYWDQWDNYMKYGFLLSKVSSRYGVLDRNGNVSIPYLYGEMQYDPFLNGVAKVQRQAGEPGSVIDLKGNVIIPEGDWQWIGSFVDGYALATQTGKSEEGYYTLDTYLLTVGDPSASTEPVTPPADTPSSWAVEQVNAAIAAGIVPDSLQSKYTQPATRAEFCALAVELYETVKGSEITERTTFTDTSDVNVQKMGALSVVTGVGGGRFDPNGTLTREQAATMLARLAEAVGKPLAAQAPTFTDNAAIASWAFDAVGQMQASGVMGGVGNNTFAPQVSYSREQSILTMLRLYESVK